jgi:hypothetical protein
MVSAPRYAALGDKDKAFAWLEKAYVGSFHGIWIRRDQNKPSLRPAALGPAIPGPASRHELAAVTL